MEKPQKTGRNWFPLCFGLAVSIFDGSASLMSGGLVCCYVLVLIATRFFLIRFGLSLLLMKLGVMTVKSWPFLLGLVLKLLLFHMILQFMLLYDHPFLLYLLYSFLFLELFLCFVFFPFSFLILHKFIFQMFLRWNSYTTCFPMFLLCHLAILMNDELVLVFLCGDTTSSIYAVVNVSGLELI